MRKIVMLVLITMAAVANARPPCDPPSLAHIPDEEQRAIIVDAWEQANTARPEERERVRQAAGLDAQRLRGCRELKAEKDERGKRPRPQ